MSHGLKKEGNPRIRGRSGNSWHEVRIGQSMRLVKNLTGLKRVGELLELI